MNRFQEKRALLFKENAKHDPSENSAKFGNYDLTTKAAISSILESYYEQLSWFKTANQDRIKIICENLSFIKAMFQILDPQLSLCMFECPEPSILQVLGRLPRAIGTFIYFLFMPCKIYVQQYLWIVITLIYIPTMFTFDTISNEYILVNPADFSKVSFDFSSTLLNCSSAPKGQPLVITYSNQIITGWYEVLVYTFTIGFAVRTVSQAQIPIYDWITVDELMDKNCETDEDEQLFSFRGQTMSTFECNNILIENYFNAILLGQNAITPNVVLEDSQGVRVPTLIRIETQIQSTSENAFEDCSSSQGRALPGWLDASVCLRCISRQQSMSH